ncbi:MAG: FMN-binding negative transcriptional regulator [Flavitalea sp.]
MYNLPEYKDHDASRVKAFMKEHPFVMICGVTKDHEPVATQIPVLIKEDAEGKIFLYGHMMRSTDHHKAFVANDAVLAVFTNPAHTYVSASWYTNPQQGSTWNYMAVHAKGKLYFLDYEGLIEVLRETTAHFENNAASPASFEHLPQKYIDKLTKAIVAFKIEVQDIQHVFKLSQNRDKQSFDNIIEKLESGDPLQKEIAREMKLRH